MKLIAGIVIYIASFFFISAKQEELIIKEKCLVYKVIYDGGKKVDSFLFQKFFLNEQFKPMSEIGYFEDSRIEYKKEYAYKNGRLSSIVNRRPGKKNERIEYIYNLSALIAKYRIFNGNQLLSEKRYSYSGDKIKDIVEYEYINKRYKFLSKETYSYDMLSRVIGESVVNSRGDTTFKAEYIYNKESVVYRAYDGDGREIESYKSFFNAGNMITQKIFYKKDSVIMKENYGYDSAMRLLKKELQNSKGEFLRSEEHSYTNQGNKSRIVKNDYKENRKEVIDYNTRSEKIVAEEYWDNDSVEIKLYYKYFTLRQ